MAAIITEILEPRKFEVIRDRIALILLEELTNQATIIPDANLVPKDGVYIDRSVSISDEETTVVNVMIASGNYNNFTILKQDGEYQFIIDAWQKSKYSPTVRGDTNAAALVQRLIGVIQAILMHQKYITLGFPPNVLNRVEVGEIQFLDPTDNNDASSLARGRVVLTVSVPEKNVPGEGVALGGTDTEVRLGETEFGYVFTGPGTTPPAPPADPCLWQRPIDWLPLPEVAEPTEKFVGLVAVLPGVNNRIGIQQGSIVNIDWGDGVVTLAHPAFAIITHDYDFAAMDNATLTSRGYKQVLVTVTPVTNFSSRFYFDQGGQLFPGHWLDVLSFNPGIANFSMAGSSTSKAPLLERVRLLGTNPTAFTANQAFDACISLEVFEMDFSNVSQGSLMFFLATADFTGVNLDFSRAVQLSQTFRSSSFGSIGDLSGALCLVITNLFLGAIGESIGNVDFPIATAAVGVFQGASTIKSIGTVNVPAATSMLNMYNGCNGLRGIIDVTTSALLTNMSNTFNSCWMIESITVSNCSSVTVMTNCFLSCRTLNILRLPGIAKTFSISNSKLPHDELVDLFNDLAVVGAETITITNNPGVATLTAPDIAIATGKGWTVVT